MTNIQEKIKELGRDPFIYIYTATGENSSFGQKIILVINNKHKRFLKGMEIVIRVIILEMIPLTWESKYAFRFTHFPINGFWY